MNIHLWTRHLINLSILSIAATAANANDAGRLDEKVRAADSRFENVATATAEGYAPIPCASGLTGGAMALGSEP